jgi:hypothetical protein
VHLLLSGLSQCSYTNIGNAWTEEAKTIFKQSVRWASEPLPPAPATISIEPKSGSVGTKVSVNGSGFARNLPVTVKFDDTPIATAPTDVNGSFVAVFNAPTAEPGTHKIKALDDYGAYAEANYEITWVATSEVPVLAVEVDVGSIHFRGEAAEFYILTTLNGVPVNVTNISATIYKPESPKEDLTTETKAIGLYLITYEIQADALNGAYTLKVEADINGVKGGSLRSFLVSSTLTNWDAALIAFEDGIATIQTQIGMININVTSVNSKIDELQGDITVLKTDIGEIRAAVAYVKSIIEKSNVTLVATQGDIAVLKTDIGEIRGIITSVQGDVATIETVVGQLKVALSTSGSTSGVQQNSDAGLYILLFFAGIAVTAAIIAVVLLWGSRNAPNYIHDL